MQEKIENRKLVHSKKMEGSGIGIPNEGKQKMQGKIEEREH